MKMNKTKIKWNQKQNEQNKKYEKKRTEATKENK